MIPVLEHNLEISKQICGICCGKIMDTTLATFDMQQFRSHLGHFLLVAYEGLCLSCTLDWLPDSFAS